MHNNNADFPPNTVDYLRSISLKMRLFLFHRRTVYCAGIAQSYSTVDSTYVDHYTPALCNTRETNKIYTTIECVLSKHWLRSMLLNMSMLRNKKVETSCLKLINDHCKRGIQPM